MRGRRSHGTAESGATERNRGAGRASRRGRRSCQVGPARQRTRRHAGLTRWDRGAASGRAVRRAGRAGQAGARRAGEPCVACGPNGRRRARARAAQRERLGRHRERERGPGRRQGELGRASWAAGGWGLGRVSSWVGFLVLGFLFLSNSNSNSYSNSTKLVEFKVEFEFNSNTQTSKINAPA